MEIPFAPIRIMQRNHAARKIWDEFQKRCRKIIHDSTNSSKRTKDRPLDFIWFCILKSDQCEKYFDSPKKLVIRKRNTKTQEFFWIIINGTATNSIFSDKDFQKRALLEQLFNLVITRSSKLAEILKLIRILTESFLKI